MTELQAGMKEPAAKRAILEQAGALAERQAKLSAAGKPWLEASQIRRKLLAVARSKNDKPAPDPNARVVVRSRSKQGVALFIREGNDEVQARPAPCPKP